MCFLSGRPVSGLTLQSLVLSAVGGRDGAFHTATPKVRGQGVSLFLVSLSYLLSQTFSQQVLPCSTDSEVDCRSHEVELRR